MGRQLLSGGSDNNRLPVYAGMGDISSDSETDIAPKTSTTKTPDSAASPQEAVKVGMTAGYHVSAARVALQASTIYCDSATRFVILLLTCSRSNSTAARRTSVAAFSGRPRSQKMLASQSRMQSRRSGCVSTPSPVTPYLSYHTNTSEGPRCETSQVVRRSDQGAFSTHDPRPESSPQRSSPRCTCGLPRRDCRPPETRVQWAFRAVDSSVVATQGESLV